MEAPNVHQTIRSGSYSEDAWDREIEKKREINNRGEEEDVREKKKHNNRKIGRKSAHHSEPPWKETFYFKIICSKSVILLNICDLIFFIVTQWIQINLSKI